MKIGKITNTNKKGQIVIPKEIREELDLSPDTPLNVVKRGGGVYIKPVTGVVEDSPAKASYDSVLKKTKGSWSDSDWEKTREKRSELEKAASKQRKEEW